MVIFVDIDNTICTTIGTDYIGAKPIHYKIDKINELFDKGHEIVYWTARGAISGIDYREITENQLKTWGVKFNKLMLNKPFYDLFIDDKNLTNIDQLFGFYDL